MAVWIRNIDRTESISRKTAKRSLMISFEKKSLISAASVFNLKTNKQIFRVSFKIAMLFVSCAWYEFKTGRSEHNTPNATQACVFMCEVFQWLWHQMNEIQSVNARSRSMNLRKRTQQRFNLNWKNLSFLATDFDSKFRNAHMRHTVMNVQRFISKWMLILLINVKWNMNEVIWAKRIDWNSFFFFLYIHFAVFSQLIWCKMVVSTNLRHWPEVERRTNQTHRSSVCPNRATEVNTYFFLVYSFINEFG